MNQMLSSTQNHTGDIKMIKNKLVWSTPIDRKVIVQNSPGDPGFVIRGHLEVQLTLITYSFNDDNQCDPQLSSKKRNITIQLRSDPRAPSNFKNIVSVSFQWKDSSDWIPVKLTQTPVVTLCTPRTIVWRIEELESFLFDSTRSSDDVHALKIECEIFNLHSDEQSKNKKKKKKNKKKKGNQKDGHQTTTSSPKKLDDNTYGDDYEKLFNTGELSDLIIRVPDGEFRVHKDILAKRNDKFKSLIEKQIINRKENFIQIIYVNADIMKEILRFVYVKKVNDIDKIVYDLLPGALEFDIKDLIKLCQINIIGKISKDNIEKIIDLVETYDGLDLLKNGVLEFLKNNKSCKTPEFRRCLIHLSSNFLIDLIYKVW